MLSALVWQVYKIIIAAYLPFISQLSGNSFHYAVCTNIESPKSDKNPVIMTYRAGNGTLKIGQITLGLRRYKYIVIVS